MSKQRYLIQAAAGAMGGTFRRLGHSFTSEGSVVGRADFSDEDWAILEGEPSLKITPVAGDGSGLEADVAASDALRTLVKEAIGKLEPADFGADGAPSADALRRVLPHKTKGVTAALVAEVWASLQAPAA